MMQLKPIYPKVCIVALVVVSLVMIAANDKTSLARTGDASTPGTSVALTPTLRFPSCPASIATQSPTQAATAAATMLIETALPTAITPTASQPTLTPTLPPTPVLHAGIGIQVEQVEQCGVRIVAIRADGTATKTNLQVGDVIVAVDGVRITSLDAIVRQFQAHTVGDNLVLTVQRGTQQTDVRVTLGLLAPWPTTTPQVGATLSATDQPL